MKSWLSSGGSHRLLMFSVLLFRLLKCDSILSQTAVAESPKPQLEPSNWLLTAKGSWPEADGSSFHQSPFYLFYTEGSAQAGVFGLNPKLLTDSTELASKWQLYFRYATNSQTTIRSRNKTGHQHEDCFLDQTDLKWHDSVFTGADQVHWNSTLFLNFNEFLLAFKNVQVRYTEKLAINKLDISPVHSFKKSVADSMNGIAPFASVDPNILRDRPSSVYYIGKEGLRIDLASTQTGPVEITLKILGLTSGHRQVYTVTLTPATWTGCDNPVDADGLPENIPDDVLRVAEINCTVNQGALQSVTIRSKMDSDFLAVWNVPGVVSQLNARIESLEVYTVKETADDEKTGLPFLNLNETGDACYSLLFQSNVVVDVYLTLEGLPRGLHLASLDTSGSVCLNEVIALENLQNYQITVALRERVYAEFHIVVTKTPSAPLKVLELITADNKIAALTTGWYFYSPLVNYEIADPKPVTAKGVKPAHAIEACDVSANCVQLLESLTDVPPQNGAVSGTKILSYTIAEHSKKIFAKSPLIRFKGDLSKLKFTQNLLQDTVKSYKVQIEKANEKSLKLAAPATPAVANQLRYQVQFPDEGTFQTEVTIPLNQFDFRLTNVKMSLEPMTGSGQVELVQVSYNNGWNETPFLFPAEPQSELFSIKLTEKVSISSDSLFVTAPTDLPFAPTSKRQLSFTLLSKGGKKTPANILLVLDVLPASDASIGVTEHTEITDLTKKNPKEIHLWGKDRTILAGQSGGIITNWIQSAVDSSVTIEQTGLRAQFTVTSTTAMVEAPVVYRFLLGQRSPVYSRVEESAFRTIDDKTVQIDDDIANDYSARGFVPNGPFRVAYMIVSRHSDSLTFTVDKLEVKSVPMDMTTNCELATRQWPLNCKYLPVLCADGFEADSGNTICQQRWLYNQTIKECDETVGCGNIFSKSFLRTKFTAEPNVADAVYVPYQVDDSSNADTYLQVNRLNMDQSKNDFCLEFGYAAMNSTLRVGLSPELSSKKYAIFLPRFTKDEVLELKTVCASHLSAKPETVKSLYIRFGDEAITTLDNHYVAAQITEKALKVTAAYDEGIYLANYDTAKSPLALKQQENITRHFLNANRLIQGRFFKLEGSRLVYRVTNDDVQFLKATYGENTLITDSLQTRWFKPSAAIREQVRLSLMANNVALLNSSLYDLRAVLSSTSQRSLDIKTKEELLDAKTVTFNGTSTAEYYKVTLELHLDLSQIIDELLNPKNVNERFDKLELIFDDFSVNDPCVTDDVKVKVCTKVDRGACGRKYREFTSVCDCYTGFHGDQCQN